MALTATSTALLRPVTGAGVALYSEGPPSMLRPQHWTDASLMMAQVRSQLAAMAVTVGSGLTGDGALTVVPLPSSPQALRPQHDAEPSLSLAQVWSVPALMVSAGAGSKTS